MKKAWIRILTAGSVAFLLITSSMITVAAHEMVIEEPAFAEEIEAEDIEDIEDIETVNDIVGSTVTESDTTDSDSEEYRPEEDTSTIEIDDVILEEELGSAGNQKTYTVGTNVKATVVTTNNGTNLYFDSQNGTLSKDWKNTIGFKTIETINSIGFEAGSGKMYLPSDSSYLFSNYENLFDYSMDNLHVIDTSKMDTSRVTNMNGLFCYCQGLTNLDLSSFNTRNVTNMSGMFFHCENLQKVELRNFNSSNVTNMGDMFRFCRKLKDLDLSGFDTSKVTYMRFMFAVCESLTTLNLKNFNTSNVTDMVDMFYCCRALNALNISSFDTSKVTNMAFMFNSCESLTSLDVSNLNTAKVTFTASMFSHCDSLQKLDISGFDMSKVTDASGMFYGCSNLQILKTPKKNYLGDINLPVTMYNSAGTLYTSLPVLSQSIFLAKDKQTAKQTVHALVLNGISNNSDYGCDNDQNLMYTRLCRNKLSNYFINSTNIHSLSYNCDSNPKNVTEINNWINYSFKATDDNDLSFFYYTGHTTWSNGSAANYGITLTSGGSYYRWGDLAQYLSNNIRGKIVVIMDACFTNNFITVGLGKLSATDKKRFTVIASCGDREESSNKNPCILKLIHKVYYGCFTYYLGEGIGFFDDKLKADSNGDKRITAQELYDYTRQKVYSDTVNSKFPMNVNFYSDTPNMVLFEFESTDKGFSDVQDPNHAFYKAIYWAADAGITKGYPDGTFGIDRSCTRGEMIMFLWRYAGKPAPKALSKSPFKDVPKNHAFYSAIIWASQKGITKGYPDGTFGINRNVSRGECMMFLWRLRGKPDPKAVSVSPFKDVPKTHAFYNAILWGAQKKITNGYTSGAKKGTFGINENCTRGAIVTFLYRAR